MPMQLLTVRVGKGDTERCPTWPTTLTPLLQNHRARVKTLHQQDLAQGHGEVCWPHALARKSRIPLRNGVGCTASYPLGNELGNVCL